MVVTGVARWLGGGVGTIDAGRGGDAGAPIGWPGEARGRGDGAVQWLAGRAVGTHVDGGAEEWVPDTPITGVDARLLTSGVGTGAKWVGCAEKLTA